jgi:short-subunit dehydrogenase
MISRSEEKLHSLQERLLDKFPTRAVEYFVWEASSVSSDSFQETFENLQEGHLEGKDVALLVNNVGTTENTFGWFADCDNSTRDENKLHADDLTRTITINCIFPAKLTAAIIPHLRARSHKYSAIINLSSILAHLPSPFNPIYGASKAFNRTFSRALAAEYAQLGIDVLCVSPGMVASNLTGFKNSTWFCTGARETAMYSLRALGLSIETFPHPIHGLTFLLTSILTTFIPQKWAATATALAMRFLPKPPGINVSRDFRKY